MVRRALASIDSPHIIAADGGARIAEYYGFTVHTVVGDMDSISTEELDKLIENGAQVERFPQEKDFTDLELALNHASEAGFKWMRIIGGLGDRLDQTLANIYLLALPALKDCDVSMVAGKQEIRLLKPGQHLIEGIPGDTISLIPVGGDALGIQTDGLYYPLRDETLAFGPARGISNVLQTETAQISLKEGLLLVVHTVGKA